MSSLELRRYCLDHFIADCYDRLNHCNASPSRIVTQPLPFRSIASCIPVRNRQPAWFIPLRGLDNLERARLFDILLWSSELAAKRGVFPTEKAAGAGAGS